MRYFQHRRQLALQAGVIMFAGDSLPDRLTLLLGVYMEAKRLEEAINFSFSDDRGNTIAYLERIRERLLAHHAKEEASYVHSIIRDTSTHSLRYEEVFVQRISLITMEWPHDTDLVQAWACCPINSPTLSATLENMWPELATLEADLVSRSHP